MNQDKPNYSTLKDFFEEMKKLPPMTRAEFEKFMKPRNHETISIDDIDEETMRQANKSTLDLIKNL